MLLCVLWLPRRFSEFLVKPREGAGCWSIWVRVSSHTNACKKSKKVALPFFPPKIPKFSYFQIVDLGLWACLRFLNRLKVVIVHFYTSRGNRFLYSDSYAPSSEFRTKGTEVSVPSLAEKITFEPPLLSLRVHLALNNRASRQQSFSMPWFPKFHVNLSKVLANNGKSPINRVICERSVL